MNQQLEKILKEYPQMILERNSLKHQLAHFKGLTAEEVIESMYTPHNDGERVQTSNISDKTAQIAMTYQERMERINREWYEHLEKKLLILNDEITFFESALEALSGRLPEIMKDMVIDAVTWEQLCEKYYVSRTMIAKYRKKAIAELSVLYDRHEEETRNYLLS